MPTSCYRAKQRVIQHFILQLLHKQRLFLNRSSRSNFQKQCLKYFQILTGAIPLLQQTHLKILHKGEAHTTALLLQKMKVLHQGDNFLKVT